MNDYRGRPPIGEPDPAYRSVIASPSVWLGALVGWLAIGACVVALCIVAGLVTR